MSHGAVAFQQGDGAGHRSFLLPDGDINADQVLPLLIDDGVYGDGRLAGLAIANDELALPATDRDHGINGLDAGLDGGIHILALHHTGCNAFDRTITGSLNGTLGIHRLPQGVDHASDQTITDRDRSDAPGGPGGHALDNPGIITHDDDTDGFLLQVEGNPHDTIFEADQFLRPDLGEAGEAGDAIPRLKHGTDIRNVDLGLVGFDLLLQVNGYLFYEVCHFASWI